jgi:hypothetical protein
VRVAEPRRRIRWLALVGTLTGLAVAVGYGFSTVIRIPNVNPIGFVFFLAGAAAGVWGGLVAGALGMGIYSLASPWGPPPPPLVFAAKVAGAMMFGAAGALLAAPIARMRRAFGAATLLGVAGFALTLVYLIGTDLATAVTIGMASNPLPTVIAGLTFSFAHVCTNAAIFASAGPALVRRFVARRAEAA